MEISIDIISVEIDEIYNPNKTIVITGDINVENLTHSNEKLSLIEALEGYNIKSYLQQESHFTARPALTSSAPT